MEAPLFARIAAAWERGDGVAAARWNAELVASRETAELRAETLQMGASLRTLLRDLGVEGAAALEAIDELAYATAFAWAAVAWRIDPQEALAAYLFAWIENQVLAAVKSVPLGQTQAQRMLLGLAAGIPEALSARVRGARRGALEFRARPRAAQLAPRDAVQPAVPLVSERAALRVGIGGPVGSGKTALTLGAVQGAARALRHRRR